MIPAGPTKCPDCDGTGKAALTGPERDEADASSEASAADAVVLEDVELVSCGGQVGFMGEIEFEGKTSEMHKVPDTLFEQSLQVTIRPTVSERGEDDRG